MPFSDAMADGIPAPRRAGDSKEFLLCAEAADGAGPDQPACVPEFPAAAELAHDLRSPLGSILLLADTLRREHAGPLLPAQRRQIEIIYSAAHALATFADDVMDAARGGAVLVESTPTPFSVRGILGSLRDLLEPIASAKQLQLRLQARGADLRVGHPLALQRVLLNLLTNALKFTDAGSVELAVAPLRRGRLRFSVTDTGPGMPPSVKARLRAPSGALAAGLAPDERARSETFGLAICVNVLKMIGSRLDVDGPPSGGTVCSFELDLPVYAPRSTSPRYRRQQGADASEAL